MFRPKLCFTEIFGSQTVYHTYQANMYTSKVIQVSPLLPKSIKPIYQRINQPQKSMKKTNNLLLLN